MFCSVYQHSLQQNIALQFVLQCLLPFSVAKHRTTNCFVVFAYIFCSLRATTTCFVVFASKAVTICFVVLATIVCSQSGHYHYSCFVVFTSIFCSKTSDYKLFCQCLLPFPVATKWLQCVLQSQSGCKRFIVFATIFCSVKAVITGSLPMTCSVLLPFLQSQSGHFKCLLVSGYLLQCLLTIFCSFRAVTSIFVAPQLTTLVLQCLLPFFVASKRSLPMTCVYYHFISSLP